MRRSVLKRRTCRNSKERPSGRFLFLFVSFLAIGMLAGTSRLHSQKRITKTLLNPEITSISIDAALCYQIVLETVATEEVTVEAQMEGEYRTDLIVQLREAGATLFIEPQFRPEFTLPNDKLGAHKVVSVRLKISLPVDQNVVLSAATCDVRTSGRFRDLKIVFNDGSCQLGHVGENTEVQTGSASIRASLPSGVVEASSRYGEVLLEPIPPGDHRLQLSSTRGNISVQCCP